MAEDIRFSERLLWFYSAAILSALVYAAVKPSIDQVFGPPMAGKDQSAQSPALARADEANGSQEEVPASDRETEPGETETPETEDPSGEAPDTGAQLAETPTSDEPESTQAVDGLGLLASGFELTENGSRTNNIEADNAGNIEVRKSVYLGGAPIGTIPVTIDPNAQLLLESRDIRNLLSTQAGIGRRLNTLPEEGLVSFQRLRNSGIDLRYNPTGDRIVLRLT